MRPAGELSRQERFTSFMTWIRCYRHQDTDTWPPGLAEQAQALLRWHDGHQFCSKSGQPTKKNMAGSKRVCPSNNIIYYPQA